MTTIIAAASIAAPALRVESADPPLAASPEPLPARFPVTPTDVALDPDGTLRGWLISPDGRPVGDVRVHVYHRDRLVASANTDAEGRFVTSSLRGGVYWLSAGESGAVVRLWAPHTAPPGARHRAVVVTGPVARAQLQPLASLLGSPWVITGTIAAAVAIPIAIYNNRDDRPEGS